MLFRSLYWTGAYTLQMIIYAVIVRMVNHYGWYIGMLVTALYSLTFLVGTFLLPDFDRPQGTKPVPAADSPDGPSE